MKAFLDRDFLLESETARRLFHEAAAGEPIFDYHCHLPPAEIAGNRRFDNLAEVWLGGDHYKWRAMRSNGVSERLITGDAEPYDKFMAWAETVPRLFGNPLYHWTHLELQRYFGITEPLSPASAPAIWKAANEKLAGDPSLSVFGIFKKFKVFAVGTTDDPVDSLEAHRAVAASGASATKVLPSFRPDPALDIQKPPFTDYLARLGQAAGVAITELEGLFEALDRRVEHFAAAGCRASDHALEAPPFPLEGSGDLRKGAAAAFAKALRGEAVTALEAETYQAALLCHLAKRYREKGWAMQLHFAALRNTNSVRLGSLGPNTGYDVSHDLALSAKLSRLLDAMNSGGGLPRTILYTLNPKDYYPLATVMGAFQQEGIPGAMQLGSAWWFLDHRDGMEEQMRILASLGLLSRFVGMLTDSRSFLSYPRHEYFRRILCNLLGRWAENGEVPNDMEMLSTYVRDISFGNAKRYFGAA